MKYIWVAYLTACASVVALADEVHLTNGRTLVGIAHEESNQWMVETRHGDMRVAKTDVQAVVPGRTPMHEYQEEIQHLDASCPTAEQVYGMALWAESEGLIRYVNPLLNRVIQIDPEHRDARQRLGFVQHDGKWMGASARDALVGVEQTVRRRAEKPKAPPVRRRPSIEETPYSLGLPLLPNRRTDKVYPEKRGYYSSGGYDLSIGGVSPSGGVVIPYPYGRPAVVR
jgi:hypothetical protein